MRKGLLPGGILLFYMVHRSPTSRLFFCGVGPILYRGTLDLQGFEIITDIRYQCICDTTANTFFNFLISRGSQTGLRCSEAFPISQVR